MEATSKYKELAKYIDQFANLNVNISNGSCAPHKPILLLTIISLIDSGDIWENVIRPTDKIRAIFEALWINYVPKELPFAVAPWTPFWHLKNEPFWHFKPKEIGFDIDSLAEPGQTAKIGEIRDKTTMEAAIDMAESGHLVIGTLHTKSCAETIDRIIKHNFRVV